MPANPKHLTKSPWHQLAKISAGILGGYFITVLFHMSLSLWLPNPKEIVVSFIVTFYIVWCTFLIIPFLFKNGWKAWLLYGSIIIILYAIYYLGNESNPFIL